MFIRLVLCILGLCLALSANAIRYEVFKKGSDLLVKEVDEFVLVGSSVLAPIKLPYKEPFYLMSATDSSYDVSRVESSFNMSGWERSEAIVLRGDFLKISPGIDIFQGTEFFIQGKDISFVGGAKNGFFNTYKDFFPFRDYLPDASHKYSSAIANATSAQLSKVTINGKDYLRYNSTNIPTFLYRPMDGYEIVAEDIGSVQSASDETLIQSPISSVTPAGTFSSTYPIELPSAEGGLRPNLTVSYTSNGLKNGLLGYGFGLTGIDTISHCPMGVDSVNSSNKRTNLVQNETLTGYCYNGVPLIKVHSATGAPTSNVVVPAVTFRLKNNPKLRFYKSNDEFTLYLADGSKKIFNKVNDLTWAISKYSTVYDQASNNHSISYQYTNTGTKTGQVVPRSISWGDYRASFTYSNKRNDFDVTVKNDGSGLFSREKLLTNISISKSSRTLNNISLKYDLLNSVSRYAISDIQTCGYIPTRLCSKPVSFEWNEDTIANPLIFSSQQSDIAKTVMPAKLTKTGADSLLVYDKTRIYKVNENGFGKIALYYHRQSGEKIEAVYPFESHGVTKFAILTSSKTQERVPDGYKWINSWTNACSYEGSGECSEGYTCSMRLDSNGNNMGNQCYAYIKVPDYDTSEKITFKWYIGTPNSSGSGITSISKGNAGCVVGDADVPENFTSSAPFLLSNHRADNEDMIYLRRWMKGSSTDECVVKGEESDFDLVYQGYLSDTLEYVVSQTPATSAGYESTRQKLNSGLTGTEFLANSSTYDYQQSDIDGNGVLDNLEINVTTKTVTIHFNAPYRGDQPLSDSIDNVPSNSISIRVGSDKVLPLDIDHDGVQELLFTSGTSLKYADFHYNPIEDQLESRISILYSDIGSMTKLSLADVNNDGIRNLLLANDSEIKILALSQQPVITRINYGNYQDSIVFSNSNQVVTTNSNLSANHRIQKPRYPVVSRVEKQFKNDSGNYEDLSRIAYSYVNPKFNYRKKIALGFEKVTKIDEINLAKTETTYYQDVLKRGLIKSIVNQLKVGENYEGKSKIENHYTQYSLHDLGLGLYYSKKTEFIKGSPANYLKQVYTYDDFGRTKAVTKQLYTVNNQLIKSNLYRTQYKNDSFSHTSSIDELPEFVDNALTIPSTSPLVDAGYQAGSKTTRKKYRTAWSKVVDKVTNGYLDETGAFVQTSAKYIDQSPFEQGNVPRTIEYGKEGDRSVVTEFSDYIGSQPQTISVMDGRTSSSKSTISRSYDELGRIIGEVGLTGENRSYTYDAFGRVKTLTTNRDSATYRYSTCANDSVCSDLPNSADIAWVNEINWTSGLKEYRFIDALGRKVGEASTDALGQLLYSWRTYDARNRISKEYLPCTLGVCSANSPHTSYSYEAVGVTSSDSNGGSSDAKWSVQKNLADGTTITTHIKVASCASALGSSNICVNQTGSSVTPYYIKETVVRGKQPKLDQKDALDPNLTKPATYKTYRVMDHAGNTFASIEGHGTSAKAVVFSRDLLGNKTHVHQRFGDQSSADLVRTYRYTKAGELESETNAIGVVKKYHINGHGDLLDLYTFGPNGKLYGHEDYEYDSIGRLRTRTSLYSSIGVSATQQNNGSYGYQGLTVSRQYNYSYVNHQGNDIPADFACTNAFELCSESVIDYNSGVSSYKNYSYTSDGLVSGKFETITDTRTSRSKSALFTYQYNPFGQLESESMNGYELEYDYRHDQLTRISDHHIETLWELSSLADNGTISESRIMGANELLYDTDTLGRNTTSSTLDGNGELVNSWFQGYNHLGTAAFRQAVSSTPEAENFEYDDFGQIDQTEMGGVYPYDYTIDKWANLTSRRGVNTEYSELAASCAEQMTSTSLNALPVRTGTNKWLASDRANKQYCYDQLGRQTINGENVIEYYVNGQAASISNAQSEIRLSYDSQGKPNFEQQTSVDASKNYTAWLFDGGRYEVRDDNGKVTTRIYPSYDMRVDFTNESLSGTPIHRYILSDTMGSVLGLATKNGNALELGQQRGYTPYGEHRNPADWNEMSNVEIGDAHGFTGQRYLGEFGLYQFNGRIYDTDQGRFTGPDPIVPQGLNWKSYNPFSYVFNDPMGWTDPSGYAPQVLAPDYSYETNNGYIFTNTPMITQHDLVASTVNQAFVQNSVNQIDALQTQLQLQQLTQLNTQISIQTSLNAQAINHSYTVEAQMNNIYEKYYKPLGVVGDVAFAIGDLITPAAETYRALTENNYSGAMWAVFGIAAKRFDVASDLVERLNVPNRGNSLQYSVSFDTKLSKDMYPGRSDKAHFQEANQNLHQQMKSDPEFANLMEILHPGITKGVQPGARGAYPRRAPTKDVTWHHGVKPGKMQLVPRNHHSAPGAVQETLHPGGVGGMSTWGGGR